MALWTVVQRCVCITASFEAYSWGRHTLFMPFCIFAYDQIKTHYGPVMFVGCPYACLV